ncbi:MAG: biosynthetic-type acetolactate synthase large subunit [Chloroflexota bacterium]|nr:MAG: biosynthetic-type acetolactate synthase large subunit [Chloroflexota bacterium]
MAISHPPQPEIHQKGRNEGQRLSGARILCESLIREGCDTIFGIPGGVVLPLYNVLLDYPEIRHILVRHEQAGAHAADGYARASGRVGVCLATSGPAATNLVTGICSAMMDSVAMVAITGNVSTTVLGKDAFQETDIVGITMPITKHNYLVTRVEDLARVVKEAFHIASTGRPGPVLIDIPKDVFQAETTFHYPDKVDLPGFKPNLTGNAKQIRAAAALIDHARKPIILAGQGVTISGGQTELLRLAEKIEAPVICTLLGLSAFPESHPLSLAMPGMHGAGYSNKAIDECDVLIGVGQRFDDRVTGKVLSFAPNAKIIHIDIDPAEIGKNVQTDVPIVGDAKRVLASLADEVRPNQHTEWLAEVEEWKRQMPLTHIRTTSQFLPQAAIRMIWEATKGDAIIVTDVGQHQMWAAQHFWYDKPSSFISSGGLGAMGFGVPAAMGAKVAKPNDTVWAIVGDGGFQMTSQELATIAEERIGVKIALMNNGYLGMIRQWQEIFYEKRYSSSYLGGPDFVKLAEAYGIKALRATTPEEGRRVIAEAQAFDGPVLCDLQVIAEENVYPMIPPGGSIANMMLEPSDRD